MLADAVDSVVGFGVGEQLQFGFEMGEQLLFGFEFLFVVAVFVFEIACRRCLGSRTSCSRSRCSCLLYILSLHSPFVFVVCQLLAL